MSHEKILDSAVSISADEPDLICFQHSVFAQVGLPRSKPNRRVWEQTYQNSIVRLDAGVLFDGKKLVEQPLPYGPKPRIALIHLNSEAIRTNSPQVDVGHSAAEFLRRMGLNDQDGRTYNLFKRQMMALSACRLTIGYTDHGVPTTLSGVPISRFEAWITNDDRQTTLWPGELTLSSDYFESLLEHAVPLDPRAIQGLSGSALALDLYTFLAYRLHSLEKPLKVPYHRLQEQFGKEYTGEYAQINFKKEFLKALKQVQAVYPAATVRKVTGGLILNPSRPPIKPAVNP